MKRIGYCKLGRSLTLDPTRFGFQGDQEAPNLLVRLARRNPNVKWVIVGRTTEGRIDLPNVVNSWESYRDEWRSLSFSTPMTFADKMQVARFVSDKTLDVWRSLDGVVIHAGQHGTSNTPIPQANSTWAQYQVDPKHVTNPQDWSVSYGSLITRGLNALGDATDGRAPVVWLVTDPRNYIKARDIKWPTGCDDVLAQYAWDREQKHERWLDPRSPRELGFENVKVLRGGEVWLARHTYRYGGLELMILPDDWETWGHAGFDQRVPAGIASTSFNDGRAGREPRRSELIRDVLLAAFPGAEVFGKWDKVSLTDVPEGRVQLNQPHEFSSLLSRWRVTLSLPAIGTSWTVAKPFQCFAGRVICFMYGRLDDQGWILPTTLAKPIVNGRQSIAGTHEVAEGLYSIRDDWTAEDLQLARWLRVTSPAEFKLRAYQASTDHDTWCWLVDAQRALLRRRWQEAYVETEIERRLGLDDR